MKNANICNADTIGISTGFLCVHNIVNTQTARIVPFEESGPALIMYEIIQVKRDTLILKIIFKISAKFDCMVL